jgi:hypothetical protein
MGCLLLGITTPAWADPTVAQMLAYRPKQEGVSISTPTEAEQASCQVKLVRGTRQGSSGWLLLDGKGNGLRRFFDSNGDKQIDVWSYYKDGVEVYREIDSNFNGKADQYRWLNSAGMKWGVDANEDGKIDSWKMISAEEAAQEAFQALLTRDLARLQALFVSESDLAALKLPADKSEALLAKRNQAAAKFQETCGRIAALESKPQMIQVESAVPQCNPADLAGAAVDSIKHPTRSLLFEYAEKKQEWMQTGEMIQIGLAWRLTDVPYLGPETGGPITPAVTSADPALQKLLDMLTEHDKTTPPTPPQVAPTPEVVRHYLKRVEIVEQILAKSTTDKESWTKQIADNLSTAATHSAPTDKTSLKRLQQLKDQTVQTAPGSNLAGYVTFRLLWTEFSPVGTTNPKMQSEWIEKLAAFVQSYPRAEDTPDVLLQLGMNSEFTGKDDEAKRWYNQLKTSFPGTPQARKAEGAIRRIDLVGKEMELTGKTAAGSSFDVSSLKGKVVAVYYWASYGETLERDFVRMKELQVKLGAKGFEIVTVNLDDDPASALAALQKANLTGAHLVQPKMDAGGLASPLATDYGIMGVPTLFLVGKNGRVINRALHVNDLEEAVQKAL